MRRRIEDMTPRERVVLAARLTRELASELPEVPLHLPRGFIRIGEQITWTHLGRESR